MANRNLSLEELWTPEGLRCSNPGETRQLGARMAASLEVGSVLSLEGTLGAGKTEMTKGLVAALGGGDAVTSPSFSLMHEYPCERFSIFHFDFYRMENARDLLTCGYDDCLEEGVTVVEWGNKFPEVLPPGTIHLELEILPEGGRRIFAQGPKFKAQSPRPKVQGPLP